MEILLKYRCTSLKKPHKTLQKDPGPLPMLCGSGSVLQCSLRLTWWLEEAPLPPLVLPLPPTAVALLRRACSWSNSKSSRRCVKASFCWMAIRNREFRVFFSSSAAASCLCMSSNWVTYSSHLRQKRGEKSRRERRGEKINKRCTLLPAGGAICLEVRLLWWHVFSIPQTAFSRWEDEVSAYDIRLFPECFVPFSQMHTDTHTIVAFQNKH